MDNTASDTEVHIHLAGLLFCLIGLVYGFQAEYSALWIGSLLIGVAWLVIVTTRFRLDKNLELTPGRILTSGVFVVLTSIFAIVLKFRLEWSTSVSIMVAAITTALVYWMFFTLEPDRGSRHHS